MRQQIVAPGERLLGFFDGIFFEPDGKRIGGLALHDYLIVTDRHLTLWARDQFKDYVDRFPLAASFVRSSEQKDMLHGTLHLACQLPTDSLSAELDEPNEIEITFDFVPLADLKQIAELIELVGNVHRDLEAGGAGEKDRYQATWLLFNQVFVGGPAPVEVNFTADSPTAGPASDEPLVEIVEGDALDDLMTPLSRLDKLDGDKPRRSASPPQPISLPRREPTFAPSDEGGSELERIEAELRWLNAPGQPTSKAARSSGADVSGSVAPGARLKQDLNPEGLYNIGRAGRAAWDGLNKLKQEAESKAEARGANILPMLNSLRESGMNLKDVTEFVVAINGLLDTLNHSPAAYELAMNFVSRSSFMSGLGNKAAEPKGRRPIPKVENIMEDAPDDLTGSAGSDALHRVDRRKSAEVTGATPARYKVAIRKRGSEVESEGPENGSAFLQPADLDETAEHLQILERSAELEVKAEATASDENGSPLFKARPQPISIRSVPVRSSQPSNN